MTTTNRALKRTIKKSGFTQAMVANKMKMEEKTFNRKVNERGTCFDVKELRKLGGVLGLTDKQLLAIVKGKNDEGCS